MISGMSPPKRPTEAEERYSYEGLTAEIQAFIDAAPRGTQQRLAEAAFPEMTPRDATSEFRHRMNERAGARFDYEHLGRIAMAAGKIKGRPEGAPLGWPLVRWKDGDAAEGILRALRGSKD